MPEGVASGRRDAGLQAGSIEAQRERLDRTVWGDEVLAQRYEEAFVWLWDELRRSSDKYAVLEGFTFDELRIGQPTSTETRSGGITRTSLGEPSRAVSRQSWRTFLNQMKEQGYELVQSEWHHAEFERLPEGAPRSTVNMTLHVANPGQERRLIIQGALRVQWSPRRSMQGFHVPDRIEAVDLTVDERTGEPAFRELAILSSPHEPKGDIQPILVHDLDDDGRSEIVLAGCNTVHWNRGGGRFEAVALCGDPPPSVTAAVLADFTGDGVTDYLCAGKSDVPYLFVGEKGGRFPTPGRRIVETAPLDNPLSMTAGDVDGDGRTDVWISQYKAPYLGGQMPTPYYDANDGFPSYLLLNQGSGRFVDATESAGLAAKRFRRTYSNSFADLDDDGDLDLIVASDFAGVDVYSNDGSGRFSDGTVTAVDIRENFGMSHSFGDFDGDGRLDFFVTGMSSTTARRLERMGLGREEFTQHQAMRMRMGYGNRMYLAAGAGKYTQASFNDRVARTGWSWGVSAFDFDNDGDLDIYVANGHQSRETAKDYCTRFWCHDIYTGSSNHDTALASFFQRVGMRVITGGVSWNGFEHNNFFMNDPGGNFLNVGFLMNVAYEFDSRGVVSEDLDADGRVDLLVVKAEELNPGSAPGERLYVLRNQWQNESNWIGVRLAHGVPGRSPFGAKITVASPSGTYVAQIVTGDSFRAQHSCTKHFGLGSDSTVDYIEVAWVDGTVTRLDRPAPNQYHRVE